MAWLSSIANYLLVVPSKNDHLKNQSDKSCSWIREAARSSYQQNHVKQEPWIIEQQPYPKHQIPNHVSVCLWIHQLPDLRSKFLGLMKGCKVKAWKRCHRDVCSHGKQHIGEDWWHERMKYGEVFDGLGLWQFQVVRIHTQILTLKTFLKKRHLKSCVEDYVSLLLSWMLSKNGPGLSWLFSYYVTAMYLANGFFKSCIPENEWGKTLHFTTI